MYQHYEREHGPVPQHQITKELSDLTLMFIVSAIIFFLIAGAHGILMRIIQSDITLMGPNENLTFGLFYASLTIHGQMMFFGFASMLTMGISYYLVSKFAKKPLYSMNLAIWSFGTLNSGVILILVSGVMFFGAGWYNLMPLTFIPGGVGWSTFSAVIFLMADLLIVVALTLFSLNIIATVLSGKIAAGIQEIELEYDEGHRSRSDGEIDKGRVDMLTMQDIPPATRWISILGISSWLPKKNRRVVPAVSIVVVAVFVNALVQLVGNAGAFTQLAVGLSFLTNPNFEPNWLFAKDAWWFFGHPIVYFTLFSFLGAAYYYFPRYSKKTVPYDKWAYRPWPFYFVFTMMVFSHHTFMDMPNPAWLEMVAQAASFGIAFPSGLTIMTIMMYILRSRIKWNMTSMFMIAGISGWAFGGFAGVQTAWWGTNIYLHNTLNIVGHIHLVLLMGSILLGLGLIYSIVPAITKKNLSRTLGLSHIILTMIGGFGLALMFTYLGFAGVIRREAEIPQQFMWAMPWLLFFALTVGFAQIIFAYNLFRTLYRKYIEGEELFGLHIPQIHHHQQQQERTQSEQKTAKGSGDTPHPHTSDASVSQNTLTDTRRAAT
jgi:cytochrome c oxidase subunit I